MSNESVFFAQKPYGSHSSESSYGSYGSYGSYCSYCSDCFFLFFFFFLRGEILMDTQLQAAWVVSDSYRLKLHGGLPDGCSRRAQDLLRILPSASRRLSPCWAEDFLVRQKIGAARGDHAP